MTTATVAPLSTLPTAHDAHEDEPTPVPTMSAEELAHEQSVYEQDPAGGNPSRW